MALWTIIEIDDQRCDLGKPRLDVFPPVYWQSSAQSVIRHRCSPSGQSVADELRQQSDGYISDWYGTVGRLGSGYRQWLEYRSIRWADGLQRACGHVRQRFPDK